MGALVIGYFFALAALAGFAVYRAHRLQAECGHSFLPSYTIYLACWGALSLLSIVQYVVAGEFVPQSALEPLQVAQTPLWATTLAVALYYLTLFLASLTGAPLSRASTIVYAGAWGAAGALILVAGGEGRGRPAAFAVATSVALLVLKTAFTYGSLSWGFLRTRRMEDAFERQGLQRFLALQLAGFAAFDLAVRDATAVIGVHTADVAIGLVQVAMNYPALLWLERFLRRRAVARSTAPLPDDIDARLGALGLSPREAAVVHLVVVGLSHKEIAERLSIAPETVKKHTYNAYRKLGVQNRVQLSYFVQSLAGR